MAIDMKESIVSVDTAYQAKLRGYNNPPVTLEYWDDSDGIRRCPIDKVELIKDRVTWVVTHSLLNKWLMEKHNIYVKAHPLNTGEWEFILLFLNQPLEGSNGYKNRMSLHVEPYRWYSHDEAMEAGLMEALKEISVL